MNSATALHPYRSIALSIRDIWTARSRVSFGQSSDVVRREKAANDDHSQLGARQDVQRELVAIRAYAHFVTTQADMPADHRKLFLGRIIGCCDQALARLAVESS